MPAALTVDQSLVDAYLARVDRFWNNVEQFGQTLRDMTSDLKDRFMPEAPVVEEPAYQEVAAVTEEPEQAVVTADDIDLDALLQGVDLGGGLSM